MAANLKARASITIDSPRDRVWRALVDPNMIREYMFGADVRTSWEVGRPITWKGEMNGIAFEDKGVVLKFDTPKTLQFSHFSPLSRQPDLPENYHIITIDLAEADGETRVTLTQNRNETEEARQHSEQNWNLMLEGLKDVVENASSNRPSG
jgi:uncharacterized protein YndB with AHSA1/START domain